MKKPLLDITNVATTSNEIINPGPLSIEGDSISKQHPIATTSKEMIQAVPLPIRRRNNKGALKSFSNEVHWLKNKLNKMKKAKQSTDSRLKMALKLSENPTFKRALNTMTAAAVTFIMLQFREGKKNKMGRRFDKNEKILALALYKQGPRAYRWLRKLFILPSPLTITRMISTASLKAGVNINIFKLLKKRADKMNANQKHCVLLFDEIALKPHFDYNRRRDAIIGFVDNGEKTQSKIADHALVFMIKGIFYNYKQAIAYTFCAGSTPKQELTIQIKTVIRKLNSTGLVVLGTICDQGCANVSAIKSLIEETKSEYIKNNKEFRYNIFEIDGKEVVPLFDPPHLLKGIRNNLLTKDLRCTMNGEEKIAKWQHIMDLYKEDPAYQGLKLMPKLTEKHIIPDKISKMKVKCASQVFSQSVAVNMGYFADKGILKPECRDTADILLFFDKLFDSLNGSYVNSKTRLGKPLLGAVTPNSEHRKVWTQAKHVLRTMKFINSNGKSGTVPSITNWLFSIENTEYIVNKLHTTYGLTSLWMRHFNQDPLENFFGSVRSHGIRNTSPTCAGFESTFASLLINNISALHSPGANCEKDSSKTFRCLGKLFFAKNSESDRSDERSIDFNLISENIFINLEEKIKNPKIKAQLQYVAGYCIKKIKKIYKNCQTCKNDFIDVTNNSYISLRERNENKNCLVYPSNDLTHCFSQMQDVISHIINTDIIGKNLKEYIKTVFSILIDYNFITCQEHKRDNIRQLEDITCNLFLFNWCKSTNQVLNGSRTDVNINDPTQMMALKYFNKRIKK